MYPLSSQVFRLSAHLEKQHIRYRLALAALVFLATLVLGQYTYRNVVFTTDENSYLFQATTFGNLALRQSPPPPPLEQLLGGAMNVIDPQLGWFSRYPPGHALWLLPGVLLGHPRLMGALAAALSLWLLTGLARVLRSPWWAAAAFLLLSPYFLFMHGTLLSHPTGLLAVSLLLWAYLVWREHRSTLHIAVAGAAWAFLYLTRPYTAALVVPAFALDGLMIWLRRRDRATFLALVWFGVAALIGPVLFLGYNYAVTGDPQQTPYLLYDPAAALGFQGRHTLAYGLAHLLHNVLLLDTWLLGTPWALGVLVLCFLACVSSALAWIAVLAVLSIMGGYVFFYYPGFNTCGPYYYFETLPFLVLLWVLFVRRAGRLRLAGWAGLALLLFVGYLSVNFTWRKAVYFRQRTAQESALQTAIRRAPAHAIILTVNEGYFPGDDLQTRLRPNLHGLNSEPLVMRSLEEGDSILAALFPDQTLLRLRNTTPPRLEPLPHPLPPFLARIRGSRTHGQIGRGNRSGDEATWCRNTAPNEAAGFLAFGRSCIVPAGQLKAIYDLTVSNVPPSQPLILTVCGAGGHQELARREVSGTWGRTQLEVPFQLPTPASVEPRVYYSGGGEVSFWSMALAEVPATPPLQSQPPSIETFPNPSPNR